MKIVFLLLNYLFKKRRDTQIPAILRFTEEKLKFLKKKKLHAIASLLFFCPFHFMMDPSLFLVCLFLNKKIDCCITKGGGVVVVVGSSGTRLCPYGDELIYSRGSREVASRAVPNGHRSAHRCAV